MKPLNTLPGLAIVLMSLLVSCNKSESVAPTKGDFKGSWTENGNGATYTCTAGTLLMKNRILTLYAVPGAGATRNINFYLADTLANTYTVGVTGNGVTSVLVNGVNGPEGNFFFNSTSGTLTITQKQPTWISGTFEVKGNATAGSLQTLKGSFEFASIKR
ncbi:MAG: hypothetical protein K1X47_06825 [Cyclobacteriaceae bacterium]|nr:hypothetical protein [Cyclobacteriaceae bacterium]